MCDEPFGEIFFIKKSIEYAATHHVVIMVVVVKRGIDDCIHVLMVQFKPNSSIPSSIF